MHVPYFTGDLAYIAPEAVTRKRVSPEMDTYSFGILMYELACRTAIERGSDGQALSVKGARPVFPANIDPSYKVTYPPIAGPS